MIGSGGAFRRDVEGLRAVAVLAVVLYHAGVPLLSGGFVGVDVFFVISGFLITGLLLTEMRATGRIGLAAFWARRARRLLPVSAVVLLVTAVAALVILPSADQVVAFADITAAALYVANWRFAGQETEYLATDTGASPVLHYWSLAVEEQFYLVWPLLLVAVVLLTRRRATLRMPAVAVTLGLVWATSFAASWYLTAVDQPLAFFGSPTRAWQLATGALIAVAAGRIASLPSRARTPLGWAGLGLIAGSVLTVSEGAGTAYPGLAALLPTAGAAAVLAAGCGPTPRGPVRLLAWSPLQHLGRVSYSWYLWHWPPLILVPAALQRPLTLPLALLIAVVTLGVSFASYAWIEQPARHAAPFVRRTSLALAAGLVLTLIPAAAGWQLATNAERAGVALVTVSGPGESPVRRISLDTTPLPSELDVSPLLRNGCQISQTRVAPPTECVFGNRTSAKQIVLFGDSHASQWFPPLDAAAQRTGMALVARTKAACSAAAVPVLAKDRPYPQCAQWREQVVAGLEKAPPDIVVVSGTSRIWAQRIVDEQGRLLPPDEAAAAYRRGLTATLERLRRTGSRVVLIRDTPSMGMDVRRCLADKGVAAACDVLRGEAMADTGLDVEAAREAGVEVWDLTDEVCSPVACRAVVGDTVAWYDSGHLSASFTRTLDDTFVEFLADTRGTRSDVALPRRDG